MHNERLKKIEIGKRGKIYSFTKITDTNYMPSGFEFLVPCHHALIQTEEGLLTTRRLTDVGDEIIEIGTPVESVFRILRYDGDSDRGAVVYGTVYRPVLKWGNQNT